ncbi:MAG: DUF4276 family protein [Cyanobium sp. ELA712]
MIRVCIICEGSTEVEFVNRCLEPYLRPSGISAYGTILSAKLKRHRGGRVTVDRLATKISLHYREADRVTTLVDFYGFQDRGGRSRAELEADILAGAARVTTGYDARFVLPYVQMYEFEGLLFTDPQAFEWVEDGWNDHTKRILEAVTQEFSSPEKINDSRETAPSKRIARIFGGVYSKTEHGPLIAESIGMNAIRDKCPAFSEWVGKLQAWGGTG